MEIEKDQFLANSLAIGCVRLRRWLKRVDQEPAFTGTEASTMAIIVEFGAVTPKQITDLEMAKKTSTTRVLNRLEERGLIKKTAEAIDNRQYLVSATLEGRRIWFEAQLKQVSPLADRISKLNDHDAAVVEEFTEVFEKLLDINANTELLY